MTVPAGVLRHTVRIESPDSTKGSRGQPSGTFSLVDTRKAEIKPITGSEKYASSAEVSEATTRFRYDVLFENVTTSYRLVHGSTVYDIIGPPMNPNLRNREIIIDCKVQS